MDWNPDFTKKILAVAVGGIAFGAAVCYLIAENGGLLRQVNELVQGGAESAVGFTA